jgi:hypothetical protein
VRVYLPSTLPELAAALDGGELTAEIGYAVTPALREWYIEGDLEELEYAATTAAARASLRLLRDAAEGGESPPRRLVVAAELADGAVRPAPDVGRAAVRLGAPVPTRQIVSAHVDDAAAEDDVRRALAALAEADAGDEDAQFLLDQVEDHELAWFAAQELGLLVELES